MESNTNPCWPRSKREKKACRILLGRRFLVIITPLSLMLAGILFGTHFISYSVNRDILLAEEVNRVDIARRALSREFGIISSDLIYLATSGNLSRLLEGRDEQRMARLAHEYLMLSSSKGLYDQIRFLDQSGQEVVRVNYNQGQPALVPRDRLQNKGRRYYFSDAFSLRPGEIFVSPLDLNIEQGAIERPLKPMIRFGTPVVDKSGEKRGIVLLNYLGKHLLDALKDVHGGEQSHPTLVNADGYWLLGRDSEDEWGFMLKNNKSLKTRYPDVWQALNRTDKGQTTTPQGIFTYVTLYPLLEGQKSSSGATEPDRPSRTQKGTSEYFWKVISHVPSEVLRVERNKRLLNGGLQFGLLFVVSLPLSAALSLYQTRSHQAMAALRDSEQRMQDITSELAEGLLALDHDGRLTMMNPEAERLLGWRENELCGEKVHDLIHRHAGNSPASGPACRALSALEKRQIVRVDDDWFTHKDGAHLPVAYTAAPLHGEGSSNGVVIAFQDISQRKKLQDKLEQLATHDPLTNLKNRRELDRLLTLTLERSRRYQQAFGLLLIDIDHFKQVNDTHGHQVGDDVLRHIGRVLNRIMRINDCVGRYGGEEFIVVLDQSDAATARTTAERFRRIIGKSPVWISDSLSIETRVSIGVSSYPDHGETKEQLVRAADKALYAAKEGGRDQIQVADV